MNSREIIHEFVNMARHPEAKDLAEALEMESKFDDCLIEYKNYQYKILDQNNKSKSINGLFIYIQNDKISCQGKTFILKGEYKILGRPITAFDVCWALQKTHTDLMIRFNGGNYIRVGRMMGGEFDCWFWLEAKNTDGTDIFLTERSDEVCDKIAEFI